MECFVYLVLIFKANLVSANMLAERTRLSQCSGEKKQKNRIIKKSIDTNRWQCFVVALSSRLFFVNVNMALMSVCWSVGW